MRQQTGTESGGSEQQFLAVARVLRPQGRRGEVAAEILTDFPERFLELRRAFLECPGGSPQPAALEHSWFHKNRVVLKFCGIDSIEEASRLRGLHVLIPAAERAVLPEHHYYLWELKGCLVLAEHGAERRRVGRVTEVESGPGGALLHVATEGGEVLIPLAREICRKIDTETKVIVIDPPDDLLELNR